MAWSINSDTGNYEFTTTEDVDGTTLTVTEVFDLVSIRFRHLGMMARTPVRLPRQLMMSHSILITMVALRPKLLSRKLGQGHGPGTMMTPL